MRREWTGIDGLRLDKFYLLIRRFVRTATAPGGLNPKPPAIAAAAAPGTLFADVTWRGVVWPWLRLLATWVWVGRCGCLVMDREDWG
ncbi:hypothetical protein Tsubulata_048788 [Turnera subulata]|uniref:Uncharacterized protein n=1 Tax=Turnera subulata TaxID=218843 RepID=A0A9Q0JQK7_9ROSI|nr:hypothetical protein Tsubulata_048788 [Turnera subulata]